MDINEISYQINSAIFDVNKTLRPGFLEKVNEKALMVKLNSRGIKAENQVPISVEYKGEDVGDYIADLLV